MVPLEHDGILSTQYHRGAFVERLAAVVQNTTSSTACSPASRRAPRLINPVIIERLDELMDVMRASREPRARLSGGPRPATLWSRSWRRTWTRNCRPGCAPSPTTTTNRFTGSASSRSPRRRGHPQYFGHLTNDIVYKRVRAGCIGGTQKGSAQRLHRQAQGQLLFQRLTTNRGYPQLREHLGSIVTMMKMSPDWKTSRSGSTRSIPGSTGPSRSISARSWTDEGSERRCREAALDKLRRAKAHRDALADVEAVGAGPAIIGYDVAIMIIRR